jgi:carbonic anhydrase
VCANGQKQSPIDIARLTEGPLQEIALRFSYKDSPIDAVNNGHTIQFNYWTGSGLTVLAQGEAPQNFALAQFHFHSLSEHTVSGRAYPMEMHLVHKSAQGDLAVVGVLLKSADPGEAVPDNPSWAAVFGALPGQSGMRLSSKTVLNAEALLPSERSVYHYTGSLTTPPCSEGVKWFVMTEPVTLPAAFIERFRTIYTHNFRPIQAQNARALLLGVPNTDSRQGQVVH